MARDLIIDSMDDAMIVPDAHGRVVDVNSRMQVLLAEASGPQRRTTRKVDRVCRPRMCSDRCRRSCDPLLPTTQAKQDAIRTK